MLAKLRSKTAKNVSKALVIIRLAIKYNVIKY